MFEHALFERPEERATTEDVLQAVAATRPTLTTPMIKGFEQDIADYARV